MRNRTPPSEPVAHPDHRWTVRKSARRSLRQAPRFDPCSRKCARTGFQGSGSPHARHFVRAGGDMKNPSGARRSGGVQKSDRVAFRSEGSSANSARVVTQRFGAGDAAKSIGRSSVHSLLTFRVRTRRIRARDAAFTLRDSSSQAVLSNFFRRASRRAGGIGIGPVAPTTTCVVSQTPTHASPMKRPAPTSNDVLPKRVTPKPTS